MQNLFNETTANINRNYSLSRLFLENEILSLKITFFSKHMLDMNHFRGWCIEKNVPNLRSEIVHLCFGPNYLFELVFSYLNITSLSRQQNLTAQFPLIGLNPILKILYYENGQNAGL